jgi:hypothetical protein
VKLFLKCPCTACGARLMGSFFESAEIIAGATILLTAVCPACRAWFSLALTESVPGPLLQQLPPAGGRQSPAT